MMKIVKRGIDSETPVSIIGDVIMAEWYRAGEGYFGDYNPEDPNDVELLRFDIYRKTEDGDWEPVDDASYCTEVPVDTDIETQTRLLKIIYNSFNDFMSSDPYVSVKKLGECLSWISPSNLM